MHPSTLDISLTNDLRELAVVAGRIDAFCAEHGIAPAIAYAVNLSLDELLTNTISYGYRDDGQHTIDIGLRLEEGVITVEITDDGIPFEPASAPVPDTNASLRDRPIGGLGIFLVGRMMDSFKHRYSDGRNIVTLTKRAQEEAPPGKG